MDKIKHLLQETWVLWYTKYEPHKKWEDCIKKVIEISSIEDFIHFFKHKKYRIVIPNGGDLLFFKKGITPEWDSDINKNGGCWLLFFEKDIQSLISNEVVSGKAGSNEVVNGRVGSNEVVNCKAGSDNYDSFINTSNKEFDQFNFDHCWFEICSSIIRHDMMSNNVDLVDNINGVVGSSRNKKNKICIWTKDSTNLEINEKIGTHIITNLEITDKIKFYSHKDSKQKNIENIKALITLN